MTSTDCVASMERWPGGALGRGEGDLALSRVAEAASGTLAGVTTSAQRRLVTAADVLGALWPRQRAGFLDLRWFHGFTELSPACVSTEPAFLM